MSSKPLLRDENYYPAPVDGFLLSMIMLDKGEKYISSDRHAADKLFVYKGNLLGVECDEEKLTSSRGQSFLVAADQVMIMRYN
ncbi:hypothetical protein [Aureibacter tunicatorum]|uniref:Mannose-6-phosphate isomerase class I n=1 Tax=Aureibacter tunicatorum TaxID=866807 RepID=A0AAE3XRR1_9BACT|nr:hypothetical protein [Aureibacter tunicatorum]MDR6240691.1 mannose-6-phosphate isomerase class I [Aureibacter tunicatorum]